MKKQKIITIFIGCFLCGQAFAFADEDNIFYRLNHSFAVNVAALNFKYKEIFKPEQKSKKSTEAGTILGFDFSMRTVFWERIYGAFHIDFYGGALKYDGTTQGTPQKPPEPLVGDFNHWFVNTDIKTGYILPVGDSIQVIPYVGVGYRFWNRGANDIGSGKIYYQNYKTIAGIKLDLLLTENFILSPYFETGKTLKPIVKDFGSDLTWNLGSKPIYSFGLELNYRAFSDLFLNVFVNYTRFEYGMSIDKYSSKKSADCYEPNSKTNEIKVGLGIRAN
jgi:hypothetical protein